MAKTLRKANGQFNGSLGEGAKSVPTAAPITGGAVSTDVDGVAPTFPQPRTPTHELHLSERLELAQSEATDPDVLDELSRDDDIEVLRAVASNYETWRHTLDAMVRRSSTPDYGVAVAVARRTDVSSTTLDYLAENEEEDVRRAVADNPSTHPETLDMLSEDFFMDVRLYVADNTNTPPETLESLLYDEDHEVAEFAAANRSLPMSALLAISDPNTTDDWTTDVQAGAARNPSLPMERLDAATRHPHQYVRLYACLNPNVTTEMLARLMVDPHPYVRKEAANRPGARAVDPAVWEKHRLLGDSGNTAD
jgi:hypothetical protein